MNLSTAMPGTNVGIWFAAGPLLGFQSAAAGDYQ